MRSCGFLLAPAVIVLVGCAGTASDPIPARDAALATCRALAGPAAPGVQPPKLVEKGKSWRGFALGMGGFACVRVTVTPEGKLAEPEILKTDNRTFADAFVKSLSGYVYDPARKDGAAVAAQIVLTAWWSEKNLDFGVSDGSADVKPDQAP